MSFIYDKVLYCLISFGVAAFLTFGVLPKVLTSEWVGSSGVQTAEFLENENGANSSPVTAQANGLNSGLKFPALSGRVVDGAKIIDAGLEAKITSKLAAYEAKSSDQIVVATVTSLDGENLEEYSNLLFRHWKLGQVNENNGVLLFISKNDRKLRIEVGYGLEGVLTDAASKLIIDNVIVPEFKKGNFGGGINNGVDMIINVLSGDMAELESRSKRNPTKKKNNNPGIFETLFFVIWVLLFFVSLFTGMLASIFGEKIKKNHYRWLGIDFKTGRPRSRFSGRSSRRSSGGGWSSGRSSGGGFSGGGGSSGGGGASGGW
ncbi:MAG: YgcG family protein [Nitratireductor sp.]